MTTCPTCRVPYPPPDQAITNTLAAQLIDKVDHSCKFSEFGCGVKMKLRDIVGHEKTCEERTVKCPRWRCGKIVQLKKFHAHTDESGKTCIEVTKPNYCLSRGYLQGNGESIPKEDCFDLRENITFGIAEIFDDQGKKFYLDFCYLASRRSFVMCVFLAENQEVADQYYVHISIGNNNNAKFKRRVLSYEGPVLSIDQVYRSGPHDEETIAQSFCFQYETAKPYLNIKEVQVNNNHEWKVALRSEVQIKRI